MFVKLYFTYFEGVDLSSKDRSSEPCNLPLPPLYIYVALVLVIELNGEVFSFL